MSSIGTGDGLRWNNRQTLERDQTRSFWESTIFTLTWTWPMPRPLFNFTIPIIKSLLILLHSSTSARVPVENLLSHFSSQTFFTSTYSRRITARHLRIWKSCCVDNQIWIFIKVRMLLDQVFENDFDCSMSLLSNLNHGTDNYRGYIYTHTHTWKDAFTEHLAITLNTTECEYCKSSLVPSLERPCYFVSLTAILNEDS